MNEGYIKIFRKFKEWEWYNDINTSRLFIHLLLSANHKEKKWNGTTIEKGQLVTGLYSLSKETNLSVQQLRTCLTRLKSTNEITSKSTNEYSVITIVNWDKYQDCEIKSTSKSTSNLTNEQQTNNKRATTNNNVKNDKNINKYIYEQMFEEFWDKYPRKKNKEKAKEWYLKNKPTQELHDEIKMSILFCKDDEQWKKDDGQYIPYPSTFLNQKRWEDFRK